VDMINIEKFAERVVHLAQYKQQLQGYLNKKMTDVAPNLTTLIGEHVGARLISHAGSLTNLAKCPASTVQILGAEKALFRALKTRGNTPKYGLIFHSSFIGRASTKNKGRISRYIANKCSIAARIDAFSDVPTSTYGEKLHEQVEERLKFFDSGEHPRKNVDVMKQACEEVQSQIAAQNKESIAQGEPNGSGKAKKRKRKEKEAKAEAAPVATEEPKKKKKKKTEKPKEKKSKKKAKKEEAPAETGEKKKKKKKKKTKE